MLLVALILVAAPAAEFEELLHRSNIAAHAPDSFRVRLSLHAPRRSEPAQIEVWRSGTRTLVRFLDPKERGKYLLYEDDVVWVLSRGSKKPVKLPRSFRLHGSASLDDILGLDYTRDYGIREAEQIESPEGRFVMYDLEANSRKAQYSRVRYLVRVDTARPVRAEYHVRSGKLATTVEFLDWMPDHRLQPRQLRLTDVLRGNAVTTVDIVSFDPQPVPEALFDRHADAERVRLEEETYE
jgi:hypothetical protein